MKDYKRSLEIEMFLGGILKMKESTAANQLKESYSILVAHERADRLRVTKVQYERRLKNMVKLCGKAISVLAKRRPEIKAMNYSAQLERVNCAEDLYKLCIRLIPYA